MADDITLAHHPAENRYELTVDGVLAADAWARGRAAELAGARA